MKYYTTSRCRQYEMLTFPPGVFRPHRNLECSCKQSIAFNHFHCIRYTMYHPFCYKCVCNMLSNFVFFHCILYTMNSDCKEYKRIFFPLLLLTVIMTTLTHSMYTVYNQTYVMLFVLLSLLVILWCSFNTSCSFMSLPQLCHSSFFVVSGFALLYLFRVIFSMSL